MPDATLQWIVAEAHLRAWLIAAPRFAEEVRQTVLTIVTVVLVGLTMLLPGSTPMEIILQADIFSCVMAEPALQSSVLPALSHRNCSQLGCASS